MKRILLLFALLLAPLFAPDPVSAQQTAPALVTGTINAQASSCSPAAGSAACVFLQVNPSVSQVSLTVSGTFSATLQFEWSPDGGTTWVALSSTPNGGGTAVTSTTSTGVWVANTGGASFVRVRGSAYTSGVATVTLNPSQAAAASSSSSGGAPSGPAGGDLGGTYPNPTVVSVADVTSGVLPAANGGAAPIFSTAVTGVSMATSGTNTVVVGPVTMATPAANGAYRFMVQVVQTAPGSAGTCTTGVITATMSYKDADTGVVYSNNIGIQSIALSSTSVGGTMTMISTANGAANNFTSLPREFRAASGTAISYEIFQSTNSNCTTPPVFAVRPALYYMGY